MYWSTGLLDCAPALGSERSDVGEGTLHLFYEQYLQMIFDQNGLGDALGAFWATRG